MKIGDFLVGKGLITDAQLQEALAAQKEEPDKKVGEILVEAGHIDVEKFTNVLQEFLQQSGMEK